MKNDLDMALSEKGLIYTFVITRVQSDLECVVAFKPSAFTFVERVDYSIRALSVVLMTHQQTASRYIVSFEGRREQTE